MPFLEPCGFSLVGYDSKTVLVNTQRGITRKKVTGIFLDINAIQTGNCAELQKKQGQTPCFFILLVIMCIYACLNLQ